MAAHPLDHGREFKRIIQGMHRHHSWQVFSDFCELAAITLYNQLVHFDEEREARYMQTIGRYDKEEASQMARLLAITTLALADGPCDFLGGMFMELELGNHWKGQFFTPYPLCQMMAALVAGPDTEQALRAGRLVRAAEPACGAGAMVIALAEHLRRQGVPLERLQVHATDVDHTAACMAYIQLSLLDIPAQVMHGNTLSMEIYDTMPTPTWARQSWQLLEAVERDQKAGQAEPVTLELGQLDLFDVGPA